jgi:Zn-dependent peptidase ImmA (M78 family)
MRVSEQVSAQDEFKVDFSDNVGQYFKKKRGLLNGRNSEAFRSASNRNVVMPTGRRLKQFLRGAEKITDGYITVSGDEEGKVDIIRLAKDLGYKIEESDNLIKKLKDKAKEKTKWEYLVTMLNLPKENDIDGFSIPQEKLIYHKNKLKEGRKNFVITHELSHYLLGHKGIFFYRDTSLETQLEEKMEEDKLRGIDSKNDIDSKKFNGKNRKKLHEKIEYSEEADRLAAILLMPYVFMRKFKDIEDDNALADRFKVPEKAIKKRREEVIKEREKISFVPSLHTEGVEP